ncbi:uncharacterized protein LOC123011718 [Tribolium madens]|uniref:uncharacterized protein LOC123011718 n=1 Tax=Tribolium madens TaxID=41895 RepID=UPI001CF75617|nr:uncharacterized protein LOC123011718 [Tribolium madens]
MLRKKKQTTSEAGVKKENRRVAKVSEENEKLQPISIKMLQGTFYLLCIGNLFSGLILLAEILVNKHKKTYKYKKQKHRFVYLRKIKHCCVAKLEAVGDAVRGIYRRAMHEAFVATLEYLE